MRINLLLGLAILSMFIIPTAGQTPSTYKAPRSPYKDGKPDLNGIWQANNTANWDIQGHSARQVHFSAGAVFSIPAASASSRETSSDQPWARRKEGTGERLSWIPRISLLPGFRAPLHPILSDRSTPTHIWRV